MNRDQDPKKSTPRTPENNKPKTADSLFAPLEFKPLTSGLGFKSSHADSSPIPTRSGGALASPELTVPAVKPLRKIPAPRPTPPTAAPRPSIEAARPQAYQPQRPLSTQPVARPADSINQTLTPTQASMNSKDLNDSITFGWAYLAKRSLAYILDTVINCSLCALSLWATFDFLQIPLERVLFAETLIIFSGFILFFNWALVTAQEIAFSTSIGKRLWGLHIEGPASALFLRSFFFIVGILFFGGGLIWAFFDKRKRCWHDVASEIQPLEIADL